MNSYKKKFNLLFIKKLEETYPKYKNQLKFYK